MIDVQSASIIFGVIGGIAYVVTCIAFKEKPELVNFFTTALAAVSIVQSLNIMLKIYNHNGTNPDPFGVFTDDLMFICFGSIAVIWASVVSIAKTYREISLSQRATA